jgi:hypothetical protein
MSSLRFTGVTTPHHPKPRGAADALDKKIEIYGSGAAVTVPQATGNGADCAIHRGDGLPATDSACHS